jgi:hypothetical protein
LWKLSDDLANTGADVLSTFTYNPASQLKSEVRTNDAYAFTGSVNVARSYTANGLNQFSAAGAASFGYDANGNLTSDGTTSYTYDAENRLVGTSAGAVLAFGCAVSRGKTRWRSGRDSNPRYAFGVYSLSRRAPSTTRPPLRMLWKGRHYRLGSG